MNVFFHYGQFDCFVVFFDCLEILVEHDLLCIDWNIKPIVGSRVERIDRIHFLVPCHQKRLNLSLFLGFFCVFANKK